MIQCIKDSIQNVNLVIGCTYGCSYCYARMNVRRFHTIDDFEKPEFFENKLRILDRKRPRNLFLTGMSDIADWKPEWQEAIFDKMAENSQHQYVFLTKRPEDLSIETEMENAWFGVTVTCAKEKTRIQELRKQVKAKHYHVTFEPMFDDIGEVDLTGIDWIVIGTETGRRKGKSVSKVVWVEQLAEQAAKQGIPVFMKEDLLEIMGEERMIQQFPVEFEQVLKNVI